MNSLIEKPLTYREAQQAFVPPDSPLQKFANPNVLCEGWYPVGRSKEFAPGTIRRIPIGRVDLVLYRALSGSMHAVTGACPHLGADLTQGRMVERGLQCAFHHWCWSTTGSCAAGAGMVEGRRIRTYEVRERWGVLWAWVGGTPAYDLPEPDPVNARHLLRLPPQRMDCHPHMILGNGLDFTHVSPVHRFQMQEDPAVDLDPPHRLSVGIHARFGSTLMRKLLLLAGRTARWRFTTIGPSLAWLSVQAPTPFELVWAFRPLPDGTCETLTVFFLPRRLNFIRALPMMIATTWKDKRILQGLRFRPGFVRSDAVFYLYARLIEGLPEWKPDSA